MCFADVLCVCPRELGAFCQACLSMCIIVAKCGCSEHGIAAFTGHEHVPACTNLTA